MAEYRKVEIGPAIDGKRIIRSGLNPGDTIIVNGLAKVFPGMPVAPVAAPPAAKTAAK
jgi:multidrug efflux pump subunit AcrA (membrane-fusion protein)